MLPLIFDTCVARDEILSGDLSIDLFVAKLRLVVEGTDLKFIEIPINSLPIPLQLMALKP